MTGQADSTSSPAQAPHSRAPDDRNAFAEMFDAHAQHLFDYCLTMLGERSPAASATQVTLIAAHALSVRLTDAGRMRAWLLALGRRECLSSGEGLAGLRGSAAAGPEATDDGLAAALGFVDEADDDVTDAETGELTLVDIEASSGLSLRATLLALPREDREILDLIYRHDVTVDDLATLLGRPGRKVPGMLEAARSKFAAEVSRASKAARAAPGTASPAVRAEQLSALRLASLPASVWRRTARVVMDPRFRSYREAVSAHAGHLGPDGFPVQAAATPSGRKLVLSSALMAGLLLAPAAAGGAGYAAFSAISHAVAHYHNFAVTPSDPASAASTTDGLPGASPADSLPARRSSKAADHDSNPPQPRTSTSGPAHRTRSASPASSPSASSSSSSSPSPPASSSPSSSSPSPSASTSPSPSSAATTSAA